MHCAACAAIPHSFTNGLNFFMKKILQLLFFVSLFIAHCFVIKTQPVTSQHRSNATFLFHLSYALSSKPFIAIQIPDGSERWNKKEFPICSTLVNNLIRRNRIFSNSTVAQQTHLFSLFGRYKISGAY